MTQAVKLAGTAAHLQGVDMNNISLKGYRVVLSAVLSI